MLATFGQDLRQSLRSLRRRPVFALVAVLSLALGIGANTTIFSVLAGALLSPVGLEQADRIVNLSTYPLDHPSQLGGVSVPDYKAWKEQAQSFTLLGANRGNTDPRTLGSTRDQHAEQLMALSLDRDLLDVWRIRPLLGRLFTADEDRVGEPSSVMLISYRLWQRRFGGAPDIVGRTIDLDGVPRKVIGVMPKGLNETLLRPRVDLWRPMSFSPSILTSAARFIEVYARLKPGVTVAQAQAEMNAIAARRAKRYPDTDGGRGIHVERIKQSFFGNLRRPLLILEGAVAMVLLIACANVAVLLLVAATSRQTEIALRAAIGAGRSRIARQVLTESLVLAVLGGVLGLGLAWLGVKLFSALAPASFPRLSEIGIDARVLGFTAAMAVLTAAVFGLVPALSCSRPDLSRLLNDTPRGAAGSRAAKRFRLGLVVGQTALALLLLIGAGLLINSFLRLEHNRLGADPQGILSFRLSLPERQAQVYTGKRFEGVGLWRIPDSVEVKFRRVRKRLAALPGVQSVAASYVLPFSGAFNFAFRPGGQAASAPRRKEGHLSVAYVSVTPGYFKTLRVPVLRGRAFTDQDRNGSQPVVIINEVMARRYWPNKDALGKHLQLKHAPNTPSREIVGVVGNVLLRQADQSYKPIVYVPTAQQTPIWPGPSSRFARTQRTFLVRGIGNPLSLVTSVRSAVAEMDRNLPLTQVQTLEQHLGNRLQQPRMYAVLLVVFAGVAALLASVGLYGVIAYTVAERRSEIGVRMALGAGRANILRLVMRQALMIIGLGLALGLVGALALTRLLSSVLWGVTPTDPATFAVVSVLLLGVGLLACLVPLRRALALDPAATLRNNG